MLIKSPLLTQKASGALLFLLTISMIFWTCDAQNTPLDAATRIRIDSISNARIVQLQLKYDSICSTAEISHLPLLVDSIRKVRLKRIQEQLQSVPK